MVPNDNYFVLFPKTERPDNEETKRSCCLKVGPFLVIEKVLEHFNLRPMLETWFGKDSGLLLDLASYFIINEGDTHRFADYAFCHPLFSEGTKIKANLTISRFLNHITRDQIIGFLSDWNQNQDHRQRIYIINDAKNENDEATDIDFRRCMGFKDDNWPIFNTAMAFNRTNQVPLLTIQNLYSCRGISNFVRFYEGPK